MTQDWGATVVLGCSLVLASCAMVLAEVDVIRLSETGNGETPWLLAIAGLSIAAAVLSLFDGATVVLDSLAVRLLALLAAWLCVSAVLSEEPIDSIAGALGYLALGVVAVRVMHRGGWQPIAYAVIGVFLGLLVVSGVLEVAGDVESVVDGRLFLVSLDANQLARLAGLALVAGVSLIATRSFLAVVAGLSILPAAIAVLVFAESRTGTAAVLLALVVLAWHWTNKVVATAIGIVVVLGVGVLAPILLDTSLTELVSRDGEIASIASFRGRTTTWSVSLDEVRAEPLIGVGPTQDDELFAIARQEGQIDWRARNAHSVWGHLLVVGGVPAFFLFIAALIAFAFHRGAERAFALAVVVLLVFDGVSEAVFWVPGIASFALVAAAVGQQAARLPAAADPLIDVRALRSDRGGVTVPG